MPVTVGPDLVRGGLKDSLLWTRSCWAGLLRRKQHRPIAAGVVWRGGWKSRGSPQNSSPSVDWVGVA